jgi:pimeloyl-ACP methyl ester carboxylesterase
MKLVQYNNQQQVLFISGMFAGSWTWDKCHKQIIGNHLLIDKPLMGISNNVDELVKIISASVRALPAPVTVVGNSLGGYIALAVAEQVPEKVSQVLISGSAGFGSIRLDLKSRLSRESVPKIGHRLADLICHDSSKALAKDRNKLIIDLNSYLKNMIGLIRDCNTIDISDLLKNINCPIKALWGEYDIISPFADAKPILEKYSINCTITPNCGHSPMYETPTAFADWVNQCLIDESHHIIQAA